MESGEVRYPVKPQLDYLNVWVGDHLCCHHQLVPVLLVGQHPSSKFNPCKKLVVMNLYLGGIKKKMCYLLPRTGYPVTMHGWLRAPPTLTKDAS